MIPVGVYYIDPNGGCPMDGFQVMCSYDDQETCSTCIDPTEMVGHIEIGLLGWLTV